MKYRLGFVSNSSSSSFILIGRESTMDELDNPLAVVVMEGYCGEGVDYIEIKNNDDLINTIRATRYNDDFLQNSDISYYIIDEKFNMEQLPYIELDAKHIGKKIFNFEIDHHSTCDYKEFIERYTR